MNSGTFVRRQVLGIVAVVMAAFHLSTPVAAACNNVSNLVIVEPRKLTGPGHCDGASTAVFTNNSGGKVECGYAFVWGNGKKDSGMIHLKSGEKIGGAGWGIWTCGDPKSIVWRCYREPVDPGCDYPETR